MNNVERIKSYTKTIYDDEIPVSEHTAINAIHFLRLIPEHLPQPHVSSSVDGEVGVFWYKGNKAVQAYFDEESHLTWLSLDHNLIQPCVGVGDIDWSVHSALPEDFLKELEAVYA